MVSFSQKDLLLEVVLSLVGLAFIWISILQSYPYNLLPYYLLLFLPGYALINIIKPNNSLASKMIIGIFLSLLLLIYLPVAFTYLNLTFLDGLLTTLLFLTTILLSLISILSRRKIPPNNNSEEYQLASKESIKLIKKIKKKTEGKNILSEETGTYFPLYEQEPTRMNRMSLMIIYDTIERIEADKKSQEEEKVIDKKTTKDEILHPKEEGSEKTISQPIHPIKIKDPTNAFPNEMDKPPWIEGINEKSDFKNWDLPTRTAPQRTRRIFLLLLSPKNTSINHYCLLRRCAVHIVLHLFNCHNPR